MEFAYTCGGIGKGGTATLYVDGKKVGEGKVAARRLLADDSVLRVAAAMRRKRHLAFSCWPEE